ncbi:UNVERIFIED_CONTAM: hypothetical protein GTU68_027508 [Idotea baltica]|nr:hypothetical protein [Idotea baltica]
MDSIRVFASATVANVGSAFDVLGFGVDSPGDELVLRKTDQPGVKISKITGDEGRLPLETSRNTAGVSVEAYLSQIKADSGIEIEINKQMPLGSGLGSSAASSVAAVFGANKLFGDPVKQKDLLPFAMEGERIACGAAHADNVAPSLLGGFVLIRSYAPLDIVQIPCPEKLYCSIVHPIVEIRTEDARKILRKEILLKDAVIQWGNVAGLIAGLYTSDYELIGRSLDDVIIEPERSLLIPGFYAVKEAALNAGALGCSLSGSGPSIFALSDSKEVADKVGKAMSQEFMNINIQSNIYVSKINQNGPIIKE